MGPLEAKIADLLLDLENPRIAGAKDQRDALQKLLDDQKEKLLALAEDIVDEGLNPMDRFLVVRSGGPEGRPVVLEGNRRLAALRILANPTVLVDMDLKAALRKNFDKLAADFDIKAVEPLPCFEVKDRDDGKRWIHLRHTGANEGRGVVDWSGLQASRFRGSDPALQALEFVRAHGQLSQDELDLITTRFPITTLDRLLSSREVRARLGFDVKHGKLISGLVAPELMKPLKALVLDLASKRVNVSALKNQTQQTEYVDKLPPGSKPDLSKRGPARPIEGITDSDFTAPTAPKPKKRAPAKTGGTPPDRRTLVPRKTRLNVTNGRVAGIFRELGLLKIEEAPNAIAVLFRVFLELSVDHYMSRHKLPVTAVDKNGRRHDKNLKSKTREVIGHLVANGGNKKDYDGVARALDVEKSPLYVDLLNAYVHNLFVTPKTHDLRATWDDSERFFEGIWP